MIEVARIFAPFRHELGENVFDELVRVHPEGRQRPHSFWCILPIEDPRTARVLDILAREGFQPWKDTRVPRDKSREFIMDLQRQYDRNDFATFDLFEPFPEGVPDIFRTEAGLAKLPLEHLCADVSLAAGSPFHYWIFVPQRTKAVLETSGLLNLVFRPTLLVKGHSAREREHPISWEEYGDPWWELDSDFTMPRVSDSMTITDSRGEPVERGDYSNGYVRREGLYLFPELHYRSADVKQLPQFDLARTLEPFANVKGYDPLHRPLVASKRFYEFCVKHDMKIRWVPVRIDPD